MYSRTTSGPLAYFSSSDISQRTRCFYVEKPFQALGRKIVLALKDRDESKKVALTS
jgi:hypothetical protein